MLKTAPRFLLSCRSFTATGVGVTLALIGACGGEATPGTVNLPPASSVTGSAAGTMAVPGKTSAPSSVVPGNTLAQVPGNTAVPPGNTTVVPMTSAGTPNPPVTGAVPPVTSGAPTSAGTSMTPPAMMVAPPAGRTCAVTEGLIADFEEGKQDVLAIEGRAGKFEGYGDASGMQTVEIIKEGTDACNSGVLHASGSKFQDYVGVGATLNGTPIMKDGKPDWTPNVYDASAKGFTAISFRAKKGANQKTPVRMSISTPWTEGGDKATCVDSGEDTNTNPCWNHVGHFLIDDEALTDQWKTFTFCFDRDMYPMFLPTGISTDNRKKIAANALKVQFQFNQGFDPKGPTTDFEQYAFTEPFDFYLDDVKFVKTACGGTPFASTDSATDAFGTNAKLGSCEIPADAALYNVAISQAYARWKTAFVGSDGGVKSPEQNGKITSEGISYGMLISAAMGDKPTFDKIWGWAKGKLTSGLLGWDNGGGGSATDADLDIAYALLMADKQWPGAYKEAGKAMASAAKADVAGDNKLQGGSGYPNVYNPSYFAPANMRAFTKAGVTSPDWSAVISKNFSELASADSGFSGADGIVPDWSTTGTGAAVTSNVCAANEKCSGYDASRVPMRIGLDVCLGGADGQAFIKTLVTTYKAKAGASLALLKAGFDSSGKNTANSVQNEMAFIGTVGVAAMAAGDMAARDQAFRGTLDILERPEYYKTYYSTSLGLITLLMMSGNWPAP